MSLILNLTLPFFALVGLGYLASRLQWLPRDGVKSINVFVFNFAVPALIVNALARQDFANLVNGRFLVAWFLAALIIYVLGVVSAVLFFGGGRKEAALVGQASSVGNLGFLALPLLIAAAGNQVAAPVSAALIIDLVILIPFSIAILESANGKSGSFVGALLAALKGAVVNPFFLAIFVGVALSATGVGLPGPTDRFISFLAGAAGPAALFSLGASLAGRSAASDIAPIAIISVLKLLVHPVAAWFVLSAFGVEGIFLTTGIVLAAMPVAGNVFVIAEAYGVMVHRLSAAILISTIFAVITVALALQWTGLTG